MKKAFEEIIEEPEAKRELVEQALLPRVAKNAAQTAYSMAINDVQSAAMKYEAETVMQVHITPEMREDMQECVRRSKIPGACNNCNRCSLNETDYYGQAFCEVEPIKDQILAGEEWINVDMGIRHNTDNLMVEYIGMWVPKEMCTIDIQGEADDCLPCSEICTEHDGQCGEACPIQKCFTRLAQYEASGVEPDQIKELSRLYGEKCKEVAELEKRLQNQRNNQ